MKQPHSAVFQALRKGILTREPCNRCFSPETTAHHEDYSRPLDVIWLCRKCHKQRHKELKQTPGEYVPLKHPEGQKVVTWVALDPTVKQTLARLAEADSRNLSSLINKIVTDWVKAQKAGS